MTAPESRVRVLFDATRLSHRRGAVPTGIDRVDLAYLDALSNAPGFDLHPVRFGLLGPTLLSEPAVRGLAGRGLAGRWRASPDEAPAARTLRRWLESSPDTVAPAIAPMPLKTGATAADAFAYPLGALRLNALLAQPRPTIYLNTSHGRLHRPLVARWLRRSGVRSVFFLHDLIPIEFPEFNRAREPGRHARRLATMARHARRVLVNSEATRGALLKYCAERDLPPPATAVLPLGIAQVASSAAAPIRATVPYFVALSTLEPRKNHQLLLRLWQRLVDRPGAAAPRLVLVGRRGWENETVFKTLDRLRGASRHVVECPDLDDASVAAVLRGARAVLSPSFAEGFGLPVAEALALGTPAIASDLAAHREIAGSSAELLDPLDGAAWLKAIEDYSAEGSARRAARLEKVATYRAPTWDAHFARALPLLREAARLPASPALAGVMPLA